MERRSFRAMGTTIELVVEAEGAGRALDAAELEFHRLEAILSRFRSDSQLSELNQDGEIDAGPDLLAVTELALAGRERTAGRFDPTVHDALVGAGYDRTFTELGDDGPARPASCGGSVQLTGSRIELDDGVRLDFGGIGKGYAAERAASLLAEAGPCLVNAGGDVATRGGAWNVAVEPLTLELAGGALATSGRDRRRWRRGGAEQHHLIDPTDGRPSATDLVRATVVAADTVEAEIWAKALFLAGAERAAAEADERSLPCVLVTTGAVTLAGGLS